MQGNYDSVISLVSFPRPQELRDSLIVPADDGMVSDNENGNEEQEEGEEKAVPQQAGGRGDNGGDMAVEKVDAQQDPPQQEPKTVPEPEQKASTEGPCQSPLGGKPEKKQQGKWLTHRSFKKFSPRGSPRGLLGHTTWCRDAGKGFGKCSWRQSGVSMEKPYRCNECGKGCRLNSTLVTHQQHHTRAKRHRCTACSQSFGVGSAFIQHQRIHPGKESGPGPGRPCQHNVCGKGVWRPRPSYQAPKATPGREALHMWGVRQRFQLELSSGAPPADPHWREALRL